MKLTVLDAKNSRIPQAIGCPPTDPRFLATLNEAIQRLVISGKYWGLVGKFRFCAQDGCITLPQQIATIEAVNVCGKSVTVRDYWYEFIENGIGSIEDCNGSKAGCCERVAVYRGHSPTFSDVIGTDKMLKLLCDEPTDVGKQVLVMGYDQNGNWIRSTQNGSIQDGELVTLAAGTTGPTNHYFSAVTGLQAPPDMDGQWFLYEYEPSTTTMRLIGQYDYDNPRPHFARYLLPQVRECGSTCTQTMVEIMGKLDFVPVKNDTDYLLIGNIPALKEMCSAVYQSENEMDSVKKNQIILAGTTTARSLLDQELDHYLGTGRRMVMQVTGSSVGTVDPVPFIL